MCSSDTGGRGALSLPENCASRSAASSVHSAVSVAIGEAAQEKHRFRAFDIVSGEAEPVADPELESAQYYKASKLKVIERPTPAAGDPPPWLGVPPDLRTYREDDWVDDAETSHREPDE